MLGPQRWISQDSFPHWTVKCLFKVHEEKGRFIWKQWDALLQSELKTLPSLFTCPAEYWKGRCAKKHAKPGFSFYVMASDNSWLSFALTLSILYHIFISDFKKLFWNNFKLTEKFQEFLYKLFMFPKQFDSRLHTNVLNPSPQYFHGAYF